MRKATRDLLENARVEKDVENAYRAEIKHTEPSADITSPHNTDGYAKWGNVRLLLEAKLDLDLKARVPVCSTLGQMLLYLKKFEGSGEPLPNVLLVGDRDECFVLSTSSVERFLDLPLDWAVAPSTGNPELTRALVEGLNLLPYVYDVDGNLDFRAVLKRCETLAEGEVHRVRATVENLQAIFTYWVDRVFDSKRKADITPTEQVDVFLRCLFQPKNLYLHPSVKNRLVVPGYDEGVRVNPDQYRSFFEHFQQGYKPSEIERFYAMKDRLIEDDARRRQGAFFTPAIWVAEAVAEITKVLGPKWREECIVWDPAAGTANLTRDHQDWGCLISSTAERPDVQVMREHGWGGRVFQYDFLNPDSESPFFDPEDGPNVIPPDVDKMLREAAKAGKRLVFFMNPPYGTAASIETFKSSGKKGVGATLVNGEMKNAKLGAPSQQLYSQFMFRARKIAEEYGFAGHTLGLFCVPTFMSSGSYQRFRDWWYGQYSYKGGFLFQASHFADVSGRWGVSFTVWSAGLRTTTNGAADLPIRLCDVTDFEITTVGIKQVYNADGRKASSWVREPVKNFKGVDAPQMSSGLKVREKGQSRVVPGNLVYKTAMGNNLVEAADSTYMVSAGSTRGHGYSLTPANWRRAVALYGARKLVLESWDTQKDEYLSPSKATEASDTYNQWVDDCHVYALAHRYNQCSAMRDVEYKGKMWRIKNHWFWRTRSSALAMYDTADTGSLYRDCKEEPSQSPPPEGVMGMFGAEPPESIESWKVNGDPYFAHVLPALKLSPEAQRVMDLLDELLIKSLPHRETYAASKPELHLTAWDAGIYQIKHLWRDLFPDEWANLKEAFKALENKLRPGVYDHGFLKR